MQTVNTLGRRLLCLTVTSAFVLSLILFPLSASQSRSILHSRPSSLVQAALSLLFVSSLAFFHFGSKTRNQFHFLQPKTSLKKDAESPGFDALPGIYIFRRRHKPPEKANRAFDWYKPTKTEVFRNFRNIVLSNTLKQRKATSARKSINKFDFFAESCVQCHSCKFSLLLGLTNASVAVAANDA
jgi:hypothetical protein